MVTEPFNFPLIGFVNLGFGSHKYAQLGFVNVNKKDLTGAQFGFINTNGSDLKGAQFGFVNTNVGEAEGIQTGFVNTSVKKMDGLQMGFVNSTKKLKGFQLGFVNYVDSLESGAALGFLSFVRQGGYQAIELSTSEMYPTNFEVKLGTKRLYNILIASYNSKLENRFALGLGLGTLIPMGKSFSVSPELIAQSIIKKNNSPSLFSLRTQFAYHITPHVGISFGPSLSWNHAAKGGMLNEPFYAVSEDMIDDRNKLIVGGKVGLRITLSK